MQIEYEALVPEGESARENRHRNHLPGMQRVSCMPGRCIF